MRTTIKYTILSALGVVSGFCADDIIIPLDGGNIAIQATFIRQGQSYLDYRITNNTSSAWTLIKVQFDMGGICDGKPRQWTYPMLIIWSTDNFGAGVIKGDSDYVIPYAGTVDGCKTEIIKASLLFAKNQKVLINGVTGEKVDLAAELQAVKAKRDAEAAAIAEQRRIDYEEEERQQLLADKKAAADAVRQKRAAVERKRKEVEDEKQWAVYQAAKEAREYAERARIRQVCGGVYTSTIDRKAKDLTIREEQIVRACQAVGQYPPR